MRWQPGILIRGVVIFFSAKISFTDLHSAGLGWALGIPPKEEQLPKAIILRAVLANSSKRVRVLSFSSPTVAYFPFSAVGMEPSTTKR